MARTDNLTNFLTDVANAIKEKKGVDTPIKASEFDKEITNLPSGVAPMNVKNIEVIPGYKKITLIWQDPKDTYDNDGNLLCTWKGTKVVYKEGSYPTNVNDGTIAVDNQERDKYVTNGFQINGLTSGTAYYFRLFPYSDKNVYNENEANRITGVPVAYGTMTVALNLSSSNPETWGTYEDDAIGMSSESPEFDNFFGEYPCLFKDGVEVGKLNVNNYAQFEDGSPADITTGNAGDVMIVFPRLGYKIITDGNTLRVSVTDDPNKDGFVYYAHQRGSTLKDKLYIGAYLGYKDGSKLRSLSGKTPTASQTIGTFRTQARANGASDNTGGSGYDLISFYPLTLLQCISLIKHRGRNTQVALGRGYVDGNSAPTNTGGTNTKGLNFGETTGKKQMKESGVEDFYGNFVCWIDGFFYNSSRHILTATEGFNDSGSNYKDQGQGTTSNLSGYMSKIQGTSEKGFVPKETSGSETTYFGDFGYLCASRLASFGGTRDSASRAGAFHLYAGRFPSDSSVGLGGRLMYL